MSQAKRTEMSRETAIMVGANILCGFRHYVRLQTGLKSSTEIDRFIGDLCFMAMIEEENPKAFKAIVKARAADVPPAEKKKMLLAAMAKVRVKGPGPKKGKR